MSNLRDLKGKRFGRLLVIGRAHNGSYGQAYWSCLCDCGSHTVCRGTHLVQSKIMSCGCLAVEERTKHGWCGSPEYRTYFNIMKRCYDSSDSRYGDYGGRGIRVCDRWRESFSNFIQDMGKRPGKDYSIDRIDVNGDYSPDNCKWSDRFQQARNTRVRKDSKTGVRGVTVRGGRYHAQLFCNGVNHNLGWYADKNDAIKARKKAEEIFWGGSRDEI